MYDKKSFIRLSRENRKKLKELEAIIGLSSYNAVVSFLVANQNQGYPEATPELIMKDNVPVILTGIPGSGKTTFLREQIIPQINSTVFVLDVQDEYPALKKVNLGEFFGLDFAKVNRKIRFVPSSNVDVSKGESDSILRHLIMFQKDLKDWTIVVEEGHRFVDNPFLRSLMAEARKRMRKFIVVSHQTDPYKGLGMIYRVTRNSGSV